MRIGNAWRRKRPTSSTTPSWHAWPRACRRSACSPRWSAGSRLAWPPHQEPVHEQENDRPEDRDPERPQVEARDGAEIEDLRAEEPADQGTGNADQDGDQAPARVFAGQDPLRERARDQTEQDPRQEVHRSEPESRHEFLEPLRRGEQLNG